MSSFCGACGASRQSQSQSFCQSCGARLTAPAAAPAPTYPAPAPAPVPGRPEYAEHPVPPALRGDGSTGRAPVGKIVGAAAVALALVGGGLVGWQFLKPQGGAETPEQAVSEFVEAVAGQDLLGALAMLNPAEVEGVDDLVSAARERLAEEGVTGAEGDLTDAITVTLDGLEFDTDELGDSAARVELRSGTYEVSYDPAALPDRLGFVADEYPDARTWDGEIVDDIGYDFPDADWDNDHPDPYLDTVRIDGRWYISALAMYVDVFFGAPSPGDFRDEGIRPPDFDAVDDVADPVVAEEPEDVLDNLADAASDEDAAQLLANFPADQVAALRPWAVTVEDLVADEGATFDVSLDDVDTTVEEMGGDLVRLVVDEGTVYGSVEEDDGDYDSGIGTVDGRCVSTIDDSGYEDGFCLDGDIASQTGVDSFYLVLRKVDGGYQIDPIATAVDYATTMIESVPSSLVDETLERIEDDL